MWEMSLIVLKAFVLCDEIAVKPGSDDQLNLQGAGLSRIDSSAPFPLRFSFWAFVQLSDVKATGKATLAIMRADSGRRYFFRSVTVRHSNALNGTPFCIRVFDCILPTKGVYFVELWYDGEWIVDQRLEVT